MHTITTGAIHIFTFKDPSRLLSPIAHDLRLVCRRFHITLDAGRVRARFTPESIDVDGPVKGGRVEVGAFGALERGKILSSMKKDVLRTKRHDEIIFTGHLRDDTLSGGLTMVGRTVDISVDVKRADGRARGRVSLIPSRWGIKPYKALLGTLVLEDRVEVAFDIELSE